MSPRQYRYQGIGEGWEKEQEEKKCVVPYHLFLKKGWQLLPGCAHTEGDQELPGSLA